jgi:hypothetical protein
VGVHQYNVLMEDNIMAALIKRFLKNERRKSNSTWVYREEQKQFEREIERWKTAQWF